MSKAVSPCLFSRVTLALGERNSKLKSTEEWKGRREGEREGGGGKEGGGGERERERDRDRERAH